MHSSKQNDCYFNILREMLFLIIISVEGTILESGFVRTKCWVVSGLEVSLTESLAGVSVSLLKFSWCIKFISPMGLELCLPPNKGERCVAFEIMI